MQADNRLVSLSKEFNADGHRSAPAFDSLVHKARVEKLGKRGNSLQRPLQTNRRGIIVNMGKIDHLRTVSNSSMRKTPTLHCSHK
jgi:hypothetical protein